MALRSRFLRARAQCLEETTGRGTRDCREPTVRGPHHRLRRPAGVTEGLAAQPLLLRSVRDHHGQRRHLLPARHGRLRRRCHGRRSPAGHKGDALLFQLTEVVFDDFLSL